MRIFLAILTYFSYIFIIAMYTIKAAKYLKLPVHLRWELYPVMHEENYQYGGSYFEQVDWWTRIRQKRYLRGFLFLLKEYFVLGEYFQKHKAYWYFLYPWHIGFILIITFHILCFFGAVAMVFGITISSSSQSITGIVFYYAILFTGVVSFVTGAFGSVGLLIKRIYDENLKQYATPLHYFTYIFTFLIFISGFYAWYFIDPTLSEYREFWKGLITFKFIDVGCGAATHIILFNLFLVYLPYTRSMHYITRFFGFCLIRWDDEPNMRGGKLERKLQALLNQKVSWSAAHIKSGKTWGEQVEEPKMRS
ncbi:MAG: respiratory nitrate reductase subunit gamma [Proteobacteria bacterium]|nr:respiratory nitrate reductase subunit gamma [Pseudomonadota bacterium]